ncbi:hypothetical protein [Streptomyces sp. NPDC051014]|uniref:hypothetical protein n=1 Tax=Streptomyces sp. NPDC051014 TaxID=3155751 RepID=UPI0033C44841
MPGDIDGYALGIVNSLRDAYRATVETYGLEGAAYSQDGVLDLLADRLTTYEKWEQQYVEIYLRQYEHIETAAQLIYFGFLCRHEEVTPGDFEDILFDIARAGAEKELALISTEKLQHPDQAPPPPPDPVSPPAQRNRKKFRYPDSPPPPLPNPPSPPAQHSETGKITTRSKRVGWRPDSDDAPSAAPRRRPITESDPLSPSVDRAREAFEALARGLNDINPANKEVLKRLPVNQPLKAVLVKDQVVLEGTGELYTTAYNLATNGSDHFGATAWESYSRRISTFKLKITRKGKLRDPGAIEVFDYTPAKLFEIHAALQGKITKKAITTNRFAP